jgi:hypothetical protein
MSHTPLTPQATCGYPIDHRLRNAARAQRIPRDRRKALRGAVARLRRRTPQR